ncbi:MAG: M50 family metallopeptidase [Tepidisphaeraceae bacterium]
MAFEDRDYYRDQPEATGLARLGRWLLYGRVPLFTAFGIRVQAHSSLIITIVLMLTLGVGLKYVWQDQVIAACTLFVIILLHEFGHCFAARWMGGEADEIVMHPLGGLALARPPQRWWPSFVTSAGGPLVNVFICVVSGSLLFIRSGRLPWLPFYIEPFKPFDGWTDVAWWCYWIYQLSWTNLLFNLMPIFPLDGGRMTQEILWRFIGFYRSMVASCTVGIVASIVAIMIGVASFQFWLLILAIMGLMTCMQMRRQVVEAGPYAFEEEDGSFAAAHEPWSKRDADDRRERAREAKKQAKLNKQQEKLAAQARADETRLDEVLAKISTHGKDSLTRGEKRFLEEMTERKRAATAGKK